MDDARDARTAREGLAERAQRVRNLRTAWEAALIDRDAFAIAMYEHTGIPAHEIGACLSDSTMRDYQRTRMASIRSEFPERVRKFRERHPDIVITKY